MVHGYVYYGTSGFESRLIDIRSREEKYKRQVGDLEEIPLYFKFWLPESASFFLFAFQSFGGRSCVLMVSEAMRNAFEKKYKSHTLRTKKLMPNGQAGSNIGKSSVKKLTMIKRSVPKDLADRYLNNHAPDEVEMEFSIKAKPRKSLGFYESIIQKSDEKNNSILLYDGIKFDQAKADIQLGKRCRTVGVIGYDNDAGVIDLTDDVKIDSTGHPKLKEISEETDDIMLSLYKDIRI